MARQQIAMPQLGESVTEGTVTKWLKQVGEAVAEDELLFEVSTDKVDSEVPSPAAGYLVEILVPEGETVEVGVPLCVIADSPAEAPQPAPAETVPTPETPTPETPAPEPAPAREPPAPAMVTGQVLSPVVRRLMGEHGLDPARIPGTGTGGRITRDDVLSFIEGESERATAVPTPSPEPAPPVQVGPGDQIIPFSNIRRRTAEHMVRSRATSPHALMVFEVDFESVETVRTQARDEWRRNEGFSLTYLPFISRAVCDAIHDFPIVNASVEGDDLRVHGTCNLGIATDLDFQGLVVPVIKNAETKRLRGIAREIRELADRARSKLLSPDDVTGGTFTITNAGPYGSYVTGPIINQPQVAILSTDSVEKRPVVTEGPSGDAIGIHHMANLSLTWDHRAFDGAYAGAFMRRLREIIQIRDWTAELT